MDHLPVLGEPVRDQPLFTLEQPLRVIDSRPELIPERTMILARVEVRPPEFVCPRLLPGLLRRRAVPTPIAKHAVEELVEFVDGLSEAARESVEFPEIGQQSPQPLRDPCRPR